jgi:hypothetical protein
MRIRVLMKDSPGRRGYACHQRPRTGTRAVPQHPAPEFCPRPEQPRLYGGHGDSQLDCQITQRQFFYIAQHEYVAQQRRYAADFRLQGLEHFPLAEFTLRISTRSRKLGWSLPALGIEIIQVDELCKAPLAYKHEALVFDNSQQPRGKLSISIELVNVLECFPARILRFFFRFAPMAKNRGSEVRTPPSVTLYQFAEGLPIALLR